MVASLSPECQGSRPYAAGAKWTAQEDNILAAYVRTFGAKGWHSVADRMKVDFHRGAEACKKRWSRIQAKARSESTPTRADFFQSQRRPSRGTPAAASPGHPPEAAPETDVQEGQGNWEAPIGRDLQKFLGQAATSDEGSQQQAPVAAMDAEPAQETSAAAAAAGGDISVTDLQRGMAAILQAAHIWFVDPARLLDAGMKCQGPGAIRPIPHSFHPRLLESVMSQIGPSDRDNIGWSLRSIHSTNGAFTPVVTSSVAEKAKNSDSWTDHSMVTGSQSPDTKNLEPPEAAEGVVKPEDQDERGGAGAGAGEEEGNNLMAKSPGVSHGKRACDCDSEEIERQGCEKRRHMTEATVFAVRRLWENWARECEAINADVARRKEEACHCSTSQIAPACGAANQTCGTDRSPAGLPH